MSGLHWVKSSYSDEGGNNCVEIALAGNAVAVRDSKKPAAVLTFSPNSFSALVRSVTTDQDESCPSGR